MHTTDITCTCHSQQEAQAVFSEVGQVPDKGVPTTNVTKRFEVVCICFDLSCHDMILVNLTSASGGCEVACFMLTYLMYCLVKLYHFEVKYRTLQEKEGAGV